MVFRVTALRTCGFRVTASCPTASRLTFGTALWGAGPQHRPRTRDRGRSCLVPHRRGEVVPKGGQPTCGPLTVAAHIARPLWGTMLKRLSAPIAALSVAAIVVASAGTGAVAQRLIGSKDVADNSLTGKDVKNSSLTSKDVKDGSLTAADISGGLPGGATGPAGPQGAQGPKGGHGGSRTSRAPRGDTGPAGSRSPIHIVRWNVVFTANGAGAGGNFQTVVATSSAAASPSTAR